MAKKTKTRKASKTAPEYDFRGGVRGKYVKRWKDEGSIAPPKLLLFALVSGYASVPLIQLFDGWQNFGLMIPGLVFGALFYAWLPGLTQAGPAWRLGAVAFCGLAHYAAAWLATVAYLQVPPQLRWLTFVLSGLWGGLLLSGFLIVKGGRPRRWGGLWGPSLAGTGLGLAYGLLWGQMKGKNDGLEQLLFGTAQALWQAGVGYFLWIQASKKA